MNCMIRDFSDYDEIFSVNISEKKPYVSVLMITYKHENYIVQAVSTLLEQTYSDFELIISDDTSPDKTQQILLDYLNEYKGSVAIRYIRLRNNNHRHRDVFRTFARGELLLTMDGDDFSMPHRLQRTVELWKSLTPSPSTMIVNAHRYIDATGEIIGKALDNHWCMPGGKIYFKPQNPLDLSYPMFGSGTVMSHEFFCWTNQLDNSISVIAGDSVRARRALLHQGIWFVDETLFYYRVNSRSVSFSGIADKRWIHDRLLRYQILEKDYQYIMPNGVVPKDILCALRRHQKRLKWEERLIDAPLPMWIFLFVGSCIFSPSSLKNAFKARIKLLLWGDVNAQYANALTFSFRNLLKGVKGR